MDTSPSLRTDPSAAETRRWERILDQLNPESLTDALLPLVAQVEGYENPPIPHREIRRTAVLSFVAIIEALRSTALTSAAAVANEIGISRARAGVELSSLMTAMRLDFVVLWNALTAIAREDEAGLIVRHTGTVLVIIDEWVSRAQHSYFDEARRMADEATSLCRSMVATLFQETPVARNRIIEIAQQLTLDVDAPLSVLAAWDRDITPLRAWEAELRQSGTVVHTHQFDAALVVFTPTDLSDRRRWGSTRLQSLRAGLVFTVGGLEELPHAARLARDLAALFELEETGPMTWSRGWNRLIVRRLHNEGIPVIADVQEALASCSDSKRQRLVEAVDSYFSTGNIGDTAADLFCHRNTISKRLSDFRSLTGVDPTVPKEAARLVVGWNSQILAKQSQGPARRR